MKLKIKSICSTDVDDIEAWLPAKLEDIYIYMELEIGPVSSEGADLFYCRITSPEGLRVMIEQGVVPIPERALVIVSDFQWSEILARLQKIVTGCEEDTWAASVAELRCFFDWEYK